MPTPCPPALAMVGIGSNLGDRRSMLDLATLELSRLPGTHLEAVSAIHETAPLGGPPGQGKYLNAAARLQTTLAPEELLQRLLSIEMAAGRVRRVRHEPRTLDLDLLLYDQRIIESPQLVVPHPRLHQRLFVLKPLAEIAADAVHPVLHQTVAELLGQLET